MKALNTLLLTAALVIVGILILPVAVYQAVAHFWRES